MANYSACGIDCDSCKFKVEQGCLGCKEIKGKVFWGECELYQCNVEKQQEHCGKCTDFPCKKLHEWAASENDDRIDNLKNLMKQQGNFLEFSDICLITDDVLKLVRFYEDVFNVKAEGDAIHSVVKIGGLGIAIYSKISAESDMGFNFSDTGTGRFTIGFNVLDADTEYERIKELKINNLTKPQLWPWGAKSFRFTDIDGNIIVIRSLLNDSEAIVK